EGMGKNHASQYAKFGSLLKNIEVGYTFPKTWLEKAKIKGARIYLSGYNLLTFTKLKYCDPEFPSSNYGYNYPLNKTITVGLNLKF
ncbi:TonB-dependent receptor, partial [Phocaeicola coprocola]